MINKPLGLSPKRIEFKRAHLYDLNPVGIGRWPRTLAAAIALIGWFGAVAQALAPFIAFTVSFLLAPLIAWGTGGRYYLARKDEPASQRSMRLSTHCVVCEHHFEHEDMAACPAYGGAICSLCCSLDARCRDACKPHGRAARQIEGWLTALLPPRLATTLNSRLGHYLLLMLMFGAILAAILMLVEYQTQLSAGAPSDVLGNAFWTLFAVLMIVIGILAWLFVLAQENSRVAQEESSHQTRLLLEEIEAHEKTDAALKAAKEQAEAANDAKSRYLVGLGHELRTPLNAISGYAQVLERDSGMPANRKSAVSVIRRSADHLAGLIEGLLDISRIEAGRVQLARDRLAVEPFFDGIVDMFRLQAEARGLAFIHERAPNLPKFVLTDEKRLKQILINLLSNALKFTPAGMWRCACAGAVKWPRSRSRIAVSASSRMICRASSILSSGARNWRIARFPAPALGSPSPSFSPR